MRYRAISTDDHLQEAPDTWTARMAKKWGSKIPHLERLSDGGDAWVIYDVASRLPAAPQMDEKGNNLASLAFGMGVLGAMGDRRDSPTRYEDFPRSTYVPAERIKAMDQDGVDVHTFFGDVSGNAGQTFSSPVYKDEQFRLECLQAFNNHQIEEWHEAYPGRFITLAIVPMWDVKAAVAEAQRMARRGVHGLSFAFPQMYGYPHIADKYWDPLWAVAQETGLSVNYHIGSGGSMGISGQSFSGHSRYVTLAEASARSISANTQVMLTLLFSGMLERFPGLKIVSAESGLGWVPYLLEVADHQWDRQRLAREGLVIKPSEYFHRQCYVDFWFEVTGIEMRHHIGVDNIMWESDFPHPTSTYPTSWEYIDRGLSQVTPEERQKFLVDNAVKVFHLEKYQD